MKVKSLIFRIGTLTTLLGLALGACAAPGAISTPLQAPETPVTATETAVTTGAPDPTRPVEIVDAQVQIGVGSPVPVEVIASGTWPDLCAQVAQVSQQVSGNRFEINILAGPADPDCPPDHLGLPFRMAIPLNMVPLPAGMYTAAVNGAETNFEWSNTSATAAVPSPNPTGDVRPLVVEGLSVEVGIGSPIPVEVVASGTLPDLCAQLGEVRQQVTGERIEISLSATPADPTCPPDPVGIPFRVAVPLNMAEMPLATYTIAANGVETQFEWTGTSPQAMPIENLGLTFAYTGRDGNLWISEPTGGPARQITRDARGMDNSGDTLTYYFPKISSDGRYIAARRDAGTPVNSGMQYSFGLWVYNTETGEGKAVYESADSPPAGFDWKPGTHRLAYGMGSNPAYFTARGEINPALATGIYETDLDTGESRVLVEPASGYTLLLPTWSPDGRFISFDELVYMEGRGPFTYYDFEAGKYIAWGDPLGNYDWSPDGETLAYDLLSYAPNGSERIFTRPRTDHGAEVQVSPETPPGYSFYPVYSPDGTQLAYLNNPGGPESTQHTLVVQDLASGETRELGSYESVWYLEWLPEGKALLFSAGPYDAQQVYGYDLARGEAIVLAEGGQPTLAGR
jgi:Tol biopolymer transport system component